MSVLLRKNYSPERFLSKYDLLRDNKRILNAGSSSIRYGKNCVNVDIQPKAGVDVICDIQDLPDSLGRFDAVICNATLQYCQHPERAASGFHRLLHPGGYLFVDAPWVQPYCEDTPDRLRFSAFALRSLFEDFEILEIGSSIRPGSALAMLGACVAGSMTTNKYVNFALGAAASALLYPLRGIRTADEMRTAGALYLVCRKPAD